MALGDTWSVPVVCGEAEPGEGCSPKTTVKIGKALVVSDPSGDCNRDLVGAEYPGIPVSRSNSVTEIRSGSGTQPIKLPRLLQQLGGGIQTIVSKRSDGTIIAYKPVRACFKRKLIVNEDGGIADAPDLNSNIFDLSCEGSIADATHIAMAQSFVDCAGVTRFNLSFVEVGAFLNELSASNLVVFNNLTVGGNLEVGGNLNLGSVTIGGGVKIGQIMTAAVLSYDPPSIAAGAVHTIDIPVPGSGLDDFVIVSWQYGLQAGLTAVNPHVDVTGTVKISLLNTTTGAIDQGPMNIHVLVFHIIP